MHRFDNGSKLVEMVVLVFQVAEEADQGLILLEMNGLDDTIRF